MIRHKKKRGFNYLVVGLVILLSFLILFLIAELLFFNIVGFSVNEWTESSVFVFSGMPTINLILPDEGYSNTSTSVFFKYNVFSLVSNISNCSFIVNGAVNDNFLNVPMYTDINFTKTFSVGSYTWGINCTTEGNIVGSSTQRRFNITSVVPPTPPGPSGGGGGGGNIPLVVKSFTVNPELIKVKIKQGDVKSISLFIKNTGLEPLNFNVQSTLTNILISETEFSLLPGQEKEITLDFASASSAEPNLYTGKILVSAAGITKVTRIVYEIESKKAMFDVKTNVLKDYKTIIIKQNNSVAGKVEIINFGDLKNIDVEVYYAVMDFNDKIITFSQETLAIDNNLSIIKELILPKNISMGDYIFYSRVNYSGTIAFGSDTFKVIEKKEYQREYFTVLSLILIISIGVVLFLILRSFRKDEFQKLVDKFIYYGNKGDKEKMKFFYGLVQEKYKSLNSIDKEKYKSLFEKVQNIAFQK